MVLLMWRGKRIMEQQCFKDGLSKDPGRKRSTSNGLRFFSNLPFLEVWFGLRESRDVEVPKD